MEYYLFFSESIPNCDVIIVTVPTPINSEMGMDPTFVEEAGREIFPISSRVGELSF